MMKTQHTPAVLILAVAIFAGTLALARVGAFRFWQQDLAVPPIEVELKELRDFEVTASPCQTVPKPAAPKSLPDEKVFRDGVVDFHGVHLDYDSKLISAIEAKTIPRSPDLDECDNKLGGIPSEHVLLTFRGPFSEQGRAKDSNDVGEIELYKIADYERDLEPSPFYPPYEPTAILKEIVTEQPRGLALEKLLAERPEYDRDHLPFLPISEANEAFHSRVKYVSFKNGTAVFFLTQWNLETMPINKDGLEYAVQGLTHDGQYAFSASFHVAAPFLPEASEPTVVKWSEKNYLLWKRSPEYRNFIHPVISKLAVLPANKFEPSLLFYEQLVSALEIQGEQPNQK